MKYDFDLDLELNTSTGKMINQIQDNSCILEFGPGNGRMTEYLTKEKNCQVSIVEYDEELYRHVMKFAANGYLGDIETYEWLTMFSDISYDYIVFADVLEHLRDPEKVLENAAKLLKDDGKVLISFPNISHNSVLIDLFNNRLEWNRYGLLDKTHLSFYTEQGFKDWFERVGLHIQLQDYTYSKVGENEINSLYTELPLMAQYPFKNRLFGEVYQYFFILTKQLGIQPVIQVPENSNYVYQLHYMYKTAGEVHTEVLLINNSTGENKEFEINVPTETEYLHFYPFLKQTDCILSFEVKVNEREFTQFQTSADWNSDQYYSFTKDHQPVFVLTGNQVSGKTVKVKLDYLYEGEFLFWDKLLLETIGFNKKEIQHQQEKLKTLEFDYEKKIEFMSARYEESLSSSVWNRVKRKFKRRMTAKKTRDQLVQIQIESVEVDEETRRAYVRGWGFSKATKEPLFYQLQANEAPYYQVTKQYRPDVNDHFDIDEKQKLGFLMEIHHPIDSNLFHLSLLTQNNEIVYLKVDRHNLSQATYAQKIRRGLGLLKNKGLRETFRLIYNKKEKRDLYTDWMQRHEQYNQQDIEEEISHFLKQPMISIVVPVYNVEEKWLEKCVASMENQFYPNWQLCLSDDHSLEGHVRPLLERYAAKDDRIKVVFRKENGHISAATNSAIEISDGEYIGFMDNDDELAPNALYEIVKAINEQPEIDFIYTDEDKINTRDKRFDPFFKSSWNEELLQGHNYITHFVVVKRTLLDRVGLLQSEYDGSQDYDFVLRATEKAQQIHHIPKVLYHWRTVETSVAFDPQSKEYAYVAGKNAVQSAMNRKKIEANVEMTKDYGCYKTEYVIKNQPKVSVLVFGTSNYTGNTIQTILEKTTYTNYEILTTLKDQSILDQRVRIVDSETLYEMAELAQGRYFVTIRAGLVPKNSRWLDELVNYGHRSSVGIVGGKVINSQDIVFNAGITYDPQDSLLIHDQRGISNKGLGYYFRISLPREIYAVTEDCLFIRRSVYEQTSGFISTLPSELVGIDLCLQVRNKTNLKVVWEPYTVMVDMDESDSQLDYNSTKILLNRWKEAEILDPYRNPNHLER